MAAIIALVHVLLSLEGRTEYRFRIRFQILYFLLHSILKYRSDLLLRRFVEIRGHASPRPDSAVLTMQEDPSASGVEPIQDDLYRDPPF